MPPAGTITLPDELLEEVFLRLPPHLASSLVRASLAGKAWFGLLTGPRFRGRYREFHGSPPMLGFLYLLPWNTGPQEEVTLPPFVSTTNFIARIPDNDHWRDAVSDFSAWDCRHGRVLFCDTHRAPRTFVWDPMTGFWSGVDAPQDYPSQWAAVLCDVSGCDHLSCHQGPSKVIFVGLNNSDDDGSVAHVHVSSPEVGEWIKPCSALDLMAERAFIVDSPPVFIQDAIYFMLTIVDDYDDDLDDGGIAILMYDLATNCLSLIYPPPQETDSAGGTILMAMEDGGLGFAQFDGLTLNLWSRQTGSDGVIAWTQLMVVNLKEFLPVQNFKQTFWLIGSVEGSDTIFVTTNRRIYEINLNPLQCKKLWKSEKYRALFPYMSFYDQPVTLCLQNV